MKFLSEIYDVTLKRGIRNASKLGFIRPTIGEFFMTHKNFKKIEVVSIAPLGAYVGGGYKYYQDDNYTYICSKDTTITTWGGVGASIVGADSETDGLQNTIDLVSSAEDHPAAQWCYDYVSDGYDDWYLPASEELRKVCANRQYTGISVSNYYLTSTVHGIGVLDRYVDGFRCDRYGANRDSIRHVIAIRRVAV